MEVPSIAIIPARGGSKRIPGKNIRPFAGAPIMRFAIDAALASRNFDRVMVSTDSAEIAEVAMRLGAEVPFLRSAKTSDDYATTAAVLLEVLETYRAQQHNFDLGCCIYPCNPFLTAERICEGRRLLESGFDSVLTAARYASAVQRSFSVEQGRMQLLFPEHRHTRSQDLPPTFYDAGQFYWFRVASLLRTQAVWTENSGVLEIPAALAQDIDTLEDWALAEQKYRAWKAGIA